MPEQKTPQGGLAKYILVFIILFGAAVYLIEEPEVEIPLVSAPIINSSYSVTDFVNNTKDLDGKSFVMKGVIDKKSECFPCPLDIGVACAPCMPPYILITDFSKKSDSAYSVFVDFGMDQSTVDKLNIGDNIEMNVSYTANGERFSDENIAGPVLFLSFLK